MADRNLENAPRLSDGNALRAGRVTKKEDRYRKIANAVRRFLAESKKSSLADARYQTAKEFRVSLSTVVRATSDFKR